MALQFKTKNFVSPTPPSLATAESIEYVAIEAVRKHEKLQARVEGLDVEHVEDLRIAIRNHKDGNGEELPPVEVVREEADGGVIFWLWNGYHRVAAYELENATVVRAKVRSGTFHDAQVLALTTNAEHGLKLKAADKRNKLDLAFDLFKTEIEDGTCGINELARRTRLSPAYVSVFLKEKRSVGEVTKPTEQTFVRKGKVLRMKTESITGRRPNATLEDMMPAIDTWVRESYPDKAIEALGAIALEGPGFDDLLTQLEESDCLPEPHRVSDIQEACRLLLRERQPKTKAKMGGASKLGTPGKISPVATKAARADTHKATVTVTLTIEQVQALADLCRDAGRDELAQMLDAEIM